MNIGKILNNGINIIKKPNGNLKQMLILASLGVIILGFGTRQNGYVTGLPEPPTGWEGSEGYSPEDNSQDAYGPQGYAPETFSPPASTYKGNKGERKAKHQHKTAGWRPEPQMPNGFVPNEFGFENKDIKDNHNMEHKSSKYAHVEPDTRKKHRHHHSRKDEENYSQKSEVQDSPEQYSEGVNSPEVHYTVE